MRALIVYCHPNPESFTAAIRDCVIGELEKAGAAIDVIDLYGESFSPALTLSEWEGIEKVPDNRAPVEEHVALVEAADTLIFIYPTWWYGLPGMLSGWLDRVLLPGSAFVINQGGDIRPGLTNIKRLGVYTTCGASWWLTLFVGAPGKRILMRGVRLLCNSKVKTSFAAHYLMDSSSQESREKHLATIPVKVRKLIGARP